MCAHSHDYRIEPLAAQIGNREITASSMVEFESDIAAVQNFTDLGFHYIARQPILRYPEIKHSASHGRSLENGHQITHQREIVRGGESNRAAPDHGDFEGKLVLCSPNVDVNRVLGFGPVALGQKSFQRADRDRAIDFAAATRSLARMSADSAADRSKGIGIARKPVSFFKPAFRDEAYVATRVSVSGARHHAREVGVQPIAIDFFVFVAPQHGSIRYVSC